MEFNLADLYETLADAGPDHVVLVAGPDRRTRKELDDRANQVAHHLLSVGIGRGDHVGVYSRNRVEFVEAMLGCFKIGAVPININYRYVLEELKYLVDNADLVGMIVEREYFPIVAKLGEAAANIKTCLVLEDRTPIEELPSEHELYESALAAQSADRNFGVERSSDDRYIVYTGGTTGMPKGVIWRHEDVFFGCMGGGNYYDPIKRPEDIAKNATEPGFPMNPLAIAPLMHGGGQWVSFIGIYSGGKATVYTERRFDARKVLDLCAAEEVMTVAIIGDAMGRPLAEIGRDYEIPSLVNIGNGGAMLTNAVKEQLREAFPNVVITDGYGASETGSAGVGVDQEDGDMRGARFSIDDRTNVLNEDLDPITPGSGERGMLARTGHIPLGYYKDEKKTAETFKVDRNGVRWVIPGDYATIEEDGTLLLFGRGSMSINSGGEKIYPEEVEAACRSHPSVYDAIVCGVPDERWGQKVVALVQLRDGIVDLSLDALNEHCREKIAGYKVPRNLVLGPVQRTNVGKPDYVWAKKKACDELGIEA